MTDVRTTIYDHFMSWGMKPDSAAVQADLLAAKIQAGAERRGQAERMAEAVAYMSAACPGAVLIDQVVVDGRMVYGGDLTSAQRIARAKDMVADLCQGRRRWVMQVPARLDEDPDLVIMAGLIAGEQALARPEPAERVRHLKRGTTYHVAYRNAQVQSGRPLVEGDQLVVYVADADGTAWARPVDEFDDGRFELAP